MKKGFAKLFSVILVIAMMSGTLPIRQAVFAAENETATETGTKNDEGDNDKGGDEEKAPTSKPTPETKKDKSEEEKTTPASEPAISGDEDKKPAETTGTEPSKTKETEPVESKTEEPSDTKVNDPETSESQEPAETEETVPEVESEKEPVSTAKRKASNSYLAEASCTIKSPIVGDRPENNNEYKLAKNDSTEYRVDVAYWCDKDYVPLEKFDYFESGKTYYAYLFFYPNSENYFTKQTVFKVNGKTQTNVIFRDGHDEVSVLVQFIAGKTLDVSLLIQTYDVTGTSLYLNKKGGTASLDTTTVGTGDVVRVVNIYANSGFYLKKIEWYDDNTSRTDITENRSFIVGTSKPTVIVSFQEDTSSYSIFQQACSNGTIILSKTSALVSEKITVTVIPDSGYCLEKLTWKKGTGNTTTHDITESKFFFMPNGSVTISASFKPIENNTLSVTPKTTKVKYKKLRKKKQTVLRSKVLTVSNPQGNVKYSLVSVKRGKSKKYKKYFNINATTGNVTIKKKLKKGTYKITCRVTAAGNEKYYSASKTVTFKIKVK